MIQGFKLDFTSDELQDHLKERAAYHATKESWYADQIKSLKSGGVEESHASNNPIGSLASSEKDHRQKKELFSVMAEHVIPNETYRLDENDLTRLELISRMW